MIEARGLPGLVAVALVAALTKATGMGVLPLVAAEAILGDLVLEVAAAVAVVARNVVVHAEERVAGLLQVVELRVLPALRVMTVAALGAAFAVVHIIRRVTGDTFLRGVLVAVAEMTSRAGDLGVPVAEREGGLVVVVTHAPPR